MIFFYENNFQNIPLIGLSHRGDSKNYIENSLRSLRSCCKDGFYSHWNRLKDDFGSKLLPFDKNLKRLFNLNLKVEDLKFKEIDYFFKEKNCSLLSLEEALINFLTPSSTLTWK